MATVANLWVPRNEADGVWHGPGDLPEPFLTSQTLKHVASCPWSSLRSWTGGRRSTPH